MPESNACQLVLKYLLVNKTVFVKAYHDRMYFYSSGTKFSLVTAPLQKWIKKQEDARKKYDADPDPQSGPPPKTTSTLKRESTSPSSRITITTTYHHYLRH